MEKCLDKAMLRAARHFRKTANGGHSGSQHTAAWIYDDYHILEISAKQSAADCKRILKTKKGSENFPGLFDLCRKICKNAEIPGEKELTEFLSGIDCFSGEHLPQALTAVMVDFAYCAQKENDKKVFLNAVASLRKISEIDFESLLIKTSKTEKLLNADPSGIYPELDSSSKSAYRLKISENASHQGVNEEEYIAKILIKAKKNAKHIGEYIFQQKNGCVYGKIILWAELLLPVISAFSAAVLTRNVLTGFLLVFPFWRIYKFLIERNVIGNFKPKRILRLNSEGETVADVHALVTVSTLLPSAEKIRKLEEHLEKLYLSNRGGKIKICCLADFKSAQTPTKPEDKTAIRAAMQSFDRLNAKYHGGFILAVRPREYSETQEEFTGKERKRGAITELIKAAKGDAKGFSVIYGDKKDLSKVKYLITLDADTELDFDAAKELIAVAEHPLNRPVIDPEKGRVVSGYGIIAPRTENRINYADCTAFEKIKAGSNGVSVYDTLCVEKYQALFGESVFCGKGLIDVDAYSRLLNDLPQERILSHDIIESGYLRTGFASDIKVTESFPKTAVSYFARLHRWVRGDWQNVIFIFGKNPLNFVSRYKLADNIIRSLSVPVSIISLILAAFITQIPFALISAVVVVALILPELVSAVNAVVKQGVVSYGKVYFSGLLPKPLSALAGMFVSLSLSATESYVCFDAALKALWRLIISKKKLLEWTTAANTETSSSALRSALFCLPGVAAFVLLFASGIPFARLIGIIFLLSVPILLIDSRQIIPREQLSDSGKEKLREYVAAMWGFFEELCNEKSNFLPPDNIQISPKKTVAKQTSPTNIGLMLLSFLAGRDFGFIDTKELYTKLDNSLKTVEKLEKYKGNLYNWYDVTDCSILNPKFISTVDSGNFLCCLVALKEGLSEYLKEYPKLSIIIERIDVIINSTDLLCLYNKQRNLFHIGLFPDNAQKSNSYYDLLMSESRLTSYFAIAKRIVPKKHWASLGRIVVSMGRFSGLVSWTGTVFEYFMPEIFMPSPKGSVSYEALRFCLYCQRKRAGKRPFGFSESGFYAFDGNLNYQYKAHGVQKIGLRRGLNGDFVVSPYSSFLTLTTAPRLSVKNLADFEKLGAYGKYGFYEAVDFTKDRTESGEYAVIRSFMAHHIGMSFLAADNMLNGRCIQHRFMSNQFMAGGESLLEEQNLPDALAFKDVKHSETPSIRERTFKESVVINNQNPFDQKVFVYSNGRLSSCISDSGCGHLIYNGTDVTLRSTDPFINPKGIFAVFKTDKEIIPFTSALKSDKTTQFEACFNKSYALYTAQKDGLTLKMKIAVKEKEDCEIRKFIIENKQEKDIKGELIICFEPCLAPFAEFSSHPSFSKLFITDKKDEKNNCIVISRLNGDEKAAIAAGIKENCKVDYETSRERVFTSPAGTLSLGEKTGFGSKRGNPDCCCAYKIYVDISKGKKTEYNLITAVGENETEAVNNFITVKELKYDEKYAKRIPEKGEAEKTVMQKLLSATVYPKRSCGEKKSGNFERFRKTDLWSLGVSGDLPIFLLEITSPENIEQLSPFIKSVKKISACGIRTDTVICYRADEGYNSEERRQIISLLKKEYCEQMLGVKGGFFVINLNRFAPKSEEALRRSAQLSYVDGKITENEEKNNKNTDFIPIIQNSPQTLKKERFVKEFNFTNNKILIKNNSATVDIPWYMVYANQTFGMMVSDKSLGFTWALNSRENKLTPWYDDRMLDNHGEILFMNYKGSLYDLAALGKAVFTRQKAEWKFKKDNIVIIVSAKLPERGTVKKISVEMINTGNEKAEFDILYYSEPLLNDTREKTAHFSAKNFKNGAAFSNSFSETEGFSVLQVNEKADYVCFSKPDFFGRKFNSTDVVPNDPCCVVGKRIVLEKGETKKLSFYFSWAADLVAAVKMPYVCNFEEKAEKSLKINTPDAKLNLFFNSFLYHQVKNSRFYGRTGPYQCSGAYGFRDQLQDSLAFLFTEPELCKRHILRCCAAQFEEGDVLHWWHVSGGKRAVMKGIRTRCSDDMLWLPYVCSEYIKKTGDWGILNTKVPYIYSEKLAESEKERYEAVKRSKIKATVFEHCIKAVEFSMKYGKNGLALIGSCDWNDGMNNIGDIENGESVWLSMFQVIVFESMADICAEKGVSDEENKLRNAASLLRKNIEEKAWNGESYARAVLKDGSFLGLNDGYIDLIPQAFSVFAGLKNNKKAIKTAYEKLFDKEKQLVKLLSPPFESSQYEKIGYICNYPAGIRENGGQYTHAAVWLAAALFKAGMHEEGNKIIKAINPLSRYSDKLQAEMYLAEPYVLAGDVYYAENAVGRAGWSHFTGSAAWYYRLIAENKEIIE